MKYTLHIINDKGQKFYYRNVGFILWDEKLTPDYLPRYFDTIENSRSVGIATVEKGLYKYVYLCDENGAQIERIERKDPDKLKMEKASIATDEHDNG